MIVNNKSKQAGNGKGWYQKNQTIIVALITAVATIIGAVIPAYFAGKQQGKITAPCPIENTNKSYETEIRDKDAEIREMQRQASNLGNILDVVRGKVDKYEQQLSVPQNRIVLYEHIDYKGHGCYLRLGDDTTDLRIYGCGNSVSSIRVEGDIKARAYRGINFSPSPALEISHSMPSLDDYWNDRILSIIVERKETNW